MYIIGIIRQRKHEKAKLHLKYLETSQTRNIKIERINCQCGGCYVNSYSGVSNHNRSKRHQTYLSQHPVL
jgi:hypothetical protein